MPLLTLPSARAIGPDLLGAGFEFFGKIIGTDFAELSRFGV